MEEKFYTFNEVCWLFKISRPTLNRYMTEGKIKYVKTGNSRTHRVLFDKQEITKVLHSMSYPKKSAISVAKELGISRQAVYYYKDKLGRLPTLEDIKKGRK